MKKGSKQNEEVKKKIRENHSHYWTGKKRPEMSGVFIEANTGRKATKETIKKHKEWCKNNLEKLSYWKNKKMSQETVEKMKQSRLKWAKNIKLKFGKINNYRFIENRDLLKKESDRRSSAYYEWVKNVYKRDSFKCRINSKDCSGRITAHHILPWRDYEELRYIIDNGITLCQFHHPKKRIEEKRLSPYFQKLVSNLVEYTTYYDKR